MKYQLSLMSLTSHLLAPCFEWNQIGNVRVRMNDGTTSLVTRECRCAHPHSSEIAPKARSQDSSTWHRVMTATHNSSFCKTFSIETITPSLVFFFSFRATLL